MTRRETIVVLCNSYPEAEDAFLQFRSFLKSNCEWCVVRSIDSALIIETDDDLRYMFMQYQYADPLFADRIVDRIDIDRFFEDLYTYN